MCVCAFVYMCVGVCACVCACMYEDRCTACVQGMSRYAILEVAESKNMPVMSVIKNCGRKKGKNILQQRPLSLKRIFFAYHSAASRQLHRKFETCQIKTCRHHTLESPDVSQFDCRCSVLPLDLVVLIVCHPDCSLPSRCHYPNPIISCCLMLVVKGVVSDVFLFRCQSRTQSWDKSEQYIISEYIWHYLASSWPKNLVSRLPLPDKTETTHGISMQMHSLPFTTR